MQRYAIGSLDNFLQHDRGERLVSRYLHGHSHAVVMIEAVEGDGRCVRRFGPGKWDMLLASGDHQQDASRTDTFPNEIEKLARAWVHPMHIFDERKHRPLVRKTDKMICQGGEGALLLLSRA